MNVLNDIFRLHVKFEDWEKQTRLPLYLEESYSFEVAIINDLRFIVLTPLYELVSLPALKKQIKKIQEIENIPVAIKLSSISLYRREKMIENNIAFYTRKQAFLPFLGTFLIAEKEEYKKVTKLMFSTQQVALLYLYSNCEKLYVSDATKKLPFTAMTMSRAVKQLESTGLFKTSKDGVNIVIESEYKGLELFEKIKAYMSSPVFKSGYLKKEEITTDMVIAGDSALAELTMLNPNRIKTYATNSKNIMKENLDKELVDPREQVKVELWKYDPKIFSRSNIADRLSVALSFEGNMNERIEDAIDELVRGAFEK